MRHRVLRASFLPALASLACVVRPAVATDMCVDTPAGLYGALLLSSVAEQPDDDVTIKLVRGVYNWSGPSDGRAHIVPVNRLRVLGGYSADCSSRVTDPNNTVIVGGGALQFTIASTGDEVVVEGVRINRAAQFNVGGLREIGGRECETRGQRVTLRRTIVDFTGTPVIDSTRVYLNATCHDLRVENNLFIGGYGNFIVGGSDDDDMSAVIANNTIVGAATTGLTLSKSGDRAFPFQLHNNVLWNNGGLGLEDHTCCQPVTIIAHNNTWDGNGAPLLISSGNASVDPQLTSSHRLVEPSSPAINSGNNALPGGVPSTDLAGGPRVVGSTIDRGAYESAVDDAFTLTVTNANDSGTGSLRQAIISANATAGLNRITFNVPLSAGQCLVLTPASAYPDITDSLVIDGWTQPGASPNTREDGDDATICVRIVRLTTPRFTLLRVPATAAAATRLIVQGVVFGGHSTAIELAGGSNHIVSGSHFGTAVGTFYPSNSRGIRVAAPGVLIGGIDPAARNVLAGNTAAAIDLAGSGASVRNNYIGTSRDGLTTSSGLQNERGVQFTDGAVDNLVTDNVISGNDVGVHLYPTAGAGNRIAANRIGLPAPSLCGAVPPLPPCNTGTGNRVGVMLAGSAGSLASANTIALNLQQGLIVYSVAGAPGWYHRVTGNTFRSNGALGIDLIDEGSGAGVNPNGSGSAGSGANRNQNHPVPGFAGGGRRQGRVEGTLQSANGNYRIEMFSSTSCDASGHGEGQTYHGHANVQTVLGGASFSLPIGEPGGSVLGGRAITLTAIKSDGNTSEFSSCATYVCDQIFAQGFDNSVADRCPQP